MGWVCLPVRRGEEIRYVYQYVPAAALARATTSPSAGEAGRASMGPMFAVLGLTSIRGLMAGWAVSAVLLVAGLALVLTGTPGVGFALFVLGAIGSVVVTIGMLRHRAAISAESASRPARTPTARPRVGTGPSVRPGIRR